MIKAIILDVDGVIVGNKIGINFPLPHKDVMQKFKDIHAKGMPIILCTGKFNFAIQEIIKQAKLNNPHITDGGALIIDPINNKIIKKHVIERSVVTECVKRCLENNIYIELYTPEAYYIQTTQVSDFTSKRTKVLQMEPIIVDSLFSTAEKEDVIKIISFANDENDMPRIKKAIEHLGKKITFTWSFHPYTKPARPGLITAPNVSKAHAAKEAVEGLDISFDEILGVGDTIGDWNFMELCKYAATLENGEKKLKDLVKTKDKGNYFIASHIDDNGIFDILKYFTLA